jgi:uncharacterized protein YkwD
VYYRDRDTATGILAVLIILFMLGTVEALIFGGFELLEPAKNTMTGFTGMPDIVQQPQLPPMTDSQPVSQSENTTPVTSVSGKPTVVDETIPTPSAADKPATPERIVIVPPLLGKSSVPDKTTPYQSATSGKPPAIAGTEMEKHVHALVNLERTKNGLTALMFDASISAVARKYSEDMAKRDYFNHVSPEGATLADRFRVGGVQVGRFGCGENIFKCPQVKVSYYNRSGVLVSEEYYSQSEIDELAVKGWMKSPGHRDNILNRNWSAEGIGIAISAGGDVYVTQDFN